MPSPDVAPHSLAVLSGAVSGYALASHQPTGKMSMDSTSTMNSGAGVGRPVGSNSRQAGSVSGRSREKEGRERKKKKRGRRRGR